ncbi:MAG TPA: helix-turn-helix transcriptional regulator [Gemmataceae bacterium]|jgi:transcriptional regulator with XRE-family HTH domain|nr:helix-turn-helix transcriptional regulator [Gemmataceae bacterium]
MGRFALLLKELREKAGLTQEQLGDLAAIHKLTVAKLEQGIREPSWATVQALAAALGVECTAFTEEPADGDKAPTPRGRPARAATEGPAKRKAGGRGGKKGR